MLVIAAVVHVCKVRWEAGIESTKLNTASLGSSSVEQDLGSPGDAYITSMLRYDDCVSLSVGGIFPS